VCPVNAGMRPDGQLQCPALDKFLEVCDILVFFFTAVFNYGSIVQFLICYSCY